MKKINGIIEYQLELNKYQQIALRFKINKADTALKKMKRHKAPGLTGLVAEMIQASGDIGTQWILDLCNGIVKEGCTSTDIGVNANLELVDTFCYLGDMLSVITDADEAVETRI